MKMVAAVFIGNPIKIAFINAGVHSYITERVYAVFS
jgi:hypothetical protein